MNQLFHRKKHTPSDQKAAGQQVLVPCTPKSNMNAERRGGGRQLAEESSSSSGKGHRWVVGEVRPRSDRDGRGRQYAGVEEKMGTRGGRRAYFEEAAPICWRATAGMAAWCAWGRWRVRMMGSVCVGGEENREVWGGGNEKIEELMRSCLLFFFFWGMRD